MAESALVTIIAIWVTKALPLGLHELRRHRLAISVALQILIASTIASHVKVAELPPILLHAVSLEITFGSRKEEGIGLFGMDIGLSLVA